MEGSKFIEGTEAESFRVIEGVKHVLAFNQGLLVLQPLLRLGRGVSVVVVSSSARTD
jgi:hypothetical protein